jgi:hypothetical protein
VVTLFLFIQHYFLFLLTLEFYSVLRGCPPIYHPNGPQVL